MISRKHALTTFALMLMTTPAFALDGVSVVVNTKKFPDGNSVPVSNYNRKMGPYTVKLTSLDGKDNTLRSHLTIDQDKCVKAQIAEFGYLFYPKNFKLPKNRDVLKEFELDTIQLSFVQNNHNREPFREIRVEKPVMQLTFGMNAAGDCAIITGKQFQQQFDEWGSNLVERTRTVTNDLDELLTGLNGGRRSSSVAVVDEPQEKALPAESGPAPVIRNAIESGGSTLK